MEESFGLEDYSDGTPEFSVDPVCGVSVDESKAAGKTGYAGQTYYFCSVNCQRNFEESPAAYVARLGAPG
jgi:YHS domain-containing protein